MQWNIFNPRTSGRRRGAGGRVGEIRVLNARTSGADLRPSRARLVAGLAMAAALIALLVWSVALGARHIVSVLVYDNPVFALRMLDISSDGRLTPDLLREYARLREGESVFAIDLQKVRQNLLSVPRIRDVRVRRRLPDVLEVRVSERTPLARLRMPGTDLMLAVDAEGWVIVGDASAAALPLLQGFSMPGLRPGLQLLSSELHDALALLDRCARRRALLALTPREVRRVDADTLALVLDTGDEVLLPRCRLVERLDDLPDLLRHLRNRRGAAGGPYRIDMTGEVNVSVLPLEAS